MASLDLNTVSSCMASTYAGEVAAENFRKIEVEFSSVDSSLVSVSAAIAVVNAALAGVTGDVTTLNAAVAALTLSKLSCTIANAVYYIDGTSGNDANTGLAISSPMKTWTGLLAIIPTVVKHNVVIAVSGTVTNDYARWQPILLGGSILVTGGSGTTTVLGPYTADINSASALGKTTAGLTPDAYKGYWIKVNTGPCAGQTRTVHTHTATTFTPTKNWTGDPGAAEFEIVRPTTTIHSTAENYSGLNVQVVGYGAVNIERFYFTGNWPQFYVNSASKCYNFAALDVRIAGFVDGSANYNGGIINVGGVPWIQFRTDLHEFDMSLTPLVACGVHALFAYTVGCVFGHFYGCVVEYLWCTDCTCPGSSYGFIDQGCRILNLQLDRCTLAHSGSNIRTSAGYAKTSLGGASGYSGLYLLNNSSVGILGGVDISNCDTHAVEVESSILRLDGVVTGSSNTGGAGVYAHTRSVVVQKTGSTATLTGAVGDLSTNGTTEGSKWATIAAGTNWVDTNEMTLAKQAA